MAESVTIRSGGRFEEVGGYARVRRVGDHVFVAGTTAIEPSGRLHAPYDTYRQTRHILTTVASLLVQAGAGLEDIVRTTAYLAPEADLAEYVRAHGEFFAEVLPVATAVRAGLSVPGMMVEIELQGVRTQR